VLTFPGASTLKRAIAGLAVLSAATLLVYRLPVGARPDPTHSSNGEGAVRKMLAGYAAAYNKGDADAASQYFTADREFTDEEGKVVKGREAIRKDLEQLFKTARDVKIDLMLETCRSLAADACSVSATSAVSRTPGFPIANKYTLVVVKCDGAWPIADARESSAGTPAEATPLNGLGRMIGEWTGSGLSKRNRRCLEAAQIEVRSVHRLRPLQAQARHPAQQRFKREQGF